MSWYSEWMIMSITRETCRARQGAEEERGVNEGKQIMRARVRARVERAQAARTLGKIFPPHACFLGLSLTHTHTSAWNSNLSPAGASPAAEGASPAGDAAAAKRREARRDDAGSRPRVRPAAVRRAMWRGRVGPAVQALPWRGAGEEDDGHEDGGDDEDEAARLRQ